MLKCRLLFALGIILMGSFSAKAELKNLEAKRSVGDTIDTRFASLA